jgi:hypothetical protein
MPQDKLISQLMNDPTARKLFFEKQEQATSIVVAGPSDSTKSTLLTLLLPPSSNKLIGKNIGVTAQTTLIRVNLMLNSQLPQNTVIIQCRERRDSIELTFQRIYITVLADQIYDARDELEDFALSEQAVYKILDPVDRSYHAGKFAKECGLVESLRDILNEICLGVIDNPEPIDSMAKQLFKEKKAKGAKIKLKDCYDQLVEQRIFEQHEQLEKLNAQFDVLKKMVRQIFDGNWTIPEENIVISTIAEDDDENFKPSAVFLFNQLYSEDSACSIIFEEINYAACPSNDFLNCYYEKYSPSASRAMRLNILDTVGLTQISEDKEDVETALDEILSHKMDAMLFLCAANERPTVYNECIELLQQRQKKLADYPVIICRTKADMTIRNLLVREYRKDTGINVVLEDNPDYATYANKAMEIFNQEFLIDTQLRETPIGCSGESRAIEYLSLAPDLYQNLNKVLDQKLDEKHAFEILLNISAEVDRSYGYRDGRPWLQSANIGSLPMETVWGAEMETLFATAAMKLISFNNTDHKQYYKYVDEQELFAGRSVTTFRRKLSIGEGHETKAFVYANFKLHLKSIVSKWIRQTLSIEDIAHKCTIRFNLDPRNALYEAVQEEFPDKFAALIKSREDNIINGLAKYLTYDSLQTPFDSCYLNKSWDKGFRESLKMFYKKFSSTAYWTNALRSGLQIELDALLQKMYIAD